MREDLLHFIWRHRYFDHQRLATTSGLPLEILSPGRWNHDQGPDFRNARIRIGERLCEGPVELHVQANDWIRHAHDGDVHYTDTILHVVWEDDRHRGENDSVTPGGIPMLVLHHRVPKLLLARYSNWMNSRLFVPCERQLGQAPGQLVADWQQHLLLERLQQRTASIRECLNDTHQDWEETTWIWMARSMGMPVNTALFEAIARSLPVRLLARYRCRRSAVEALLLGQAGLLGAPGPHPAGASPPASEFPPELQKEFQFLKKKHGLTSPTVPVSFLRMHPAHFPPLRLVQLADLITTGWFGTIREAESAQQVLRLLEGRKGLGPDMRRGLLINAFIPLLFAYGRLRGEPVCREKALRWLKELRSERNATLTRWRESGMTPLDAGDSQALLQLKREYCDARRCLDCGIGRALLAH